VSYKTLFGSVLVIAGIILVIICLSIEHKNRIAGSLGEVPASSKVSPKTPGTAVNPVPHINGKQPPPPGGPCNIERINGELADTVAYRTSRKDIKISGWLVDQATKTIPLDASIRIEDRDHSRIWLVPIAPVIDRVDVQASQGDEPAYRHSGFSVRFALSALSPGEYRILLQYRIADQGYTCDNGRSLQIGY
jgi:hypothetical protein